MRAEAAPPGPDSALPLSPVDFHLLLALADGAAYGYAIMKAIAEHSHGAVRPEIGSLYRRIARLLTAGLVEEVPPLPTEEPAPGRPRRYYRLTARGHAVLAAEAGRLREVLAVAVARNLLPDAPRP
jgi:DNA-binding PadR family transcriptional regulator